jgi:nickel/cobalt exporter
VEAVRHHWRFDEGFSAFALQGLDTDGDGRYSKEELAPLAQENVESLGEYGFFTELVAGDAPTAFGTPRDYHLDYDGSRLTLHYALPLAAPLSASQEITLQVYDPEYYIAFGFPSAEAVRLVNAPGDCLLDVTPAKGPSPEAAAVLATIGAEQRDLPEDLQAMAGGIDNTAILDCGPQAAARRAERLKPQNAAEAVHAMADGVPAANIDLQAGPAPAVPIEASPTVASPRAAAAPSAASPPPRPASELPEPGFFRLAMAKLMALQAAFYKELTGSLKALSTDGRAFWWLGSISFLYGILHAAGPGHGKIVISSYLLANEQRLRRGIAIAFLSALAQAIVAVVLIAVLALALNMTSMAITDTAKAFELGSYALIAALGLTLLARKGRQAFAAARGAPAHHHHHHHHDHGPACGHHASPATLERPGWKGAAAAIIAVGLRPCSGALIVLVFALAQGIFWAGVASTFLMALGTAITVAALATLAVGAKDLARRLSRGGGEGGARIMLGLELCAALLITLLGILLFAGSLAAPLAA